MGMRACRWFSCTRVLTRSAMWNGRPIQSTFCAGSSKKPWCRYGRSHSPSGRARLMMELLEFAMPGRILNPNTLRYNQVQRFSANTIIALCIDKKIHETPSQSDQLSFLILTL